MLLSYSLGSRRNCRQMTVGFPKAFRPLVRGGPPEGWLVCKQGAAQDTRCISSSDSCPRQLTDHINRTHVLSQLRCQTGISPEGPGIVESLGSWHARALWPQQLHDPLSCGFFTDKRCLYETVLFPGVPYVRWWLSDP